MNLKSNQQSIAASVLAGLTLATSNPCRADDPKPANIVAALMRSADWHLANPSRTNP